MIADTATARPAPALQPYVDRYVGYRLEGFPPGLHQGLPGRYLTMIISLDAPVNVVAMPDRAQAPRSFAAPVGGLCAGPATIAHDGNQVGVSLDLSPLGARHVLGLPASALASTVVDLDELLGARATELAERLAAVDGWAARFQVLDRVLAGWLVDAPPPQPEVARAWQRLVSSGGGLAVGALAEEVGWSRRHLGKRFRDEVGLSPKQVARTVRFERSVSLLRRADGGNLAELALACGYYDQAHLNRDWRELAGLPPARWLAAELPNVQDGPMAVDAR